MTIKLEKYSSVILDHRRVLTSLTLLIARSADALAIAIVTSNLLCKLQKVLGMMIIGAANDMA